MAVTSWVRVHATDASTTFAGVMLAVGGTVIAVAATGAVLGAGTSRGNPVTGAVAVLGFLATWLVFTGRHFVAGVYASEWGVKVQRVSDTWMVPWSDVAAIERRFASAGTNPAIWLRRSSGPALETPIQCGRRAPMNLRGREGPVLSFEDFEAAGSTLEWYRQTYGGTAGGPSRRLVWPSVVAMSVGAAMVVGLLATLLTLPRPTSPSDLPGVGDVVVTACSARTVDSGTLFEARLSVTNHSGQPVGYTVTIAFRADGRLLTTASTRADAVPAHRTVGAVATTVLDGAALPAPACEVVDVRSR